MKKGYSLLTALLLAGSLTGLAATKAQAAEKSGFVTENGVTVYYDASGNLVHGKQKIDGKWYLFDDETGAMKTGFQTIAEQKKTVYYDANGRMVYGKKKIDGHWYWFDSKSGAMKTGFQTVSKKSYKTAYKWVKKRGKLVKKKYKKKSYKN